MPQRAPASIDMLHSVSRPSIDSARIAEPANSMAWPVAPSAPICAMMASTMSLAGDAGRRAAIDRDPHALRLLLPDRLRHQHMRHLGRADAERVGAERAMGRGVAVAADDQQPRQRQALLRTDHMHDALARIVEAEQLDAVLGRVLLDLPHHARQLGIGDVAPRAARRHVMVGDAEGQPGLGDRHAALGQLAEGMERALVHVVAIDPEQRLAVLATHDLVGGPELVDQGFGDALMNSRTRASIEANIEGDAGQC